MDLADGLRNSLKDHLGWGKPRLACFVSLLLAVLRIQRMDLSRLAVAMGGRRSRFPLGIAAIL
ncbi:MAG TPA: hypothetical protein PLB10_16830 [Thiolinea sp.]|nr:hypothetical protein [Thiolinea sp.]